MQIKDFPNSLEIYGESNRTKFNHHEQKIHPRNTVKPTKKSINKANETPNPKNYTSKPGLHLLVSECKT